MFVDVPANQRAKSPAQFLAQHLVPKFGLDRQLADHRRDFDVRRFEYRPARLLIEQVHPRNVHQDLELVPEQRALLAHGPYDVEMTRPCVLLLHAMHFFEERVFDVERHPVEEKRHAAFCVRLDFADTGESALAR